MGDLYDFYGALLTDRQRQIIEMYHVEDWSLGEIAEQLKISRQAVHDQLRRAGEQLEQYESALQLKAMSVKQRAALQAVMDIWTQTAGFLSEDVQMNMQRALTVLRETLSGVTGGEGDA